MKIKLMKRLACPECGKPMNLSAFSKAEEQENGIFAESILESPVLISEMSKDGFQEDIDIIAGIFRCVNGHIFPLINGIPRMFSNAACVFYKATLKYKDISESGLWKEFEDASKNTNENFDKNFSHTMYSFSAEWDGIDDSSVAWGQSPENRKQLFYETMDIKPEDLKGKIILDVGHGNGELELAICDSGAEIIAADLSFSGEKIQRRLLKDKKEYSNVVHLVQANAHHLPFKNKIFDYVHSSGVLHHTPDTYKGFKSITKHLKNDGKCFIAVYTHENKNILDRIIFEILHIIRLLLTRHEINLHLMRYALF
jgi:ubiquinone/menaquinone biosynthesis C-methylase UbiE/uncharacterized protein YbaR (Trm112 family)